MKIKFKRSLVAPLLVLVMYILMAVTNRINFYDLGLKDNVYLAVIIIQMMIFVIPGLIYCKLRGKELTSELRLKGVGMKGVWLTLSSFFTLIFGSSLIKLALYALGYYSRQYTLYENYIPTDTSGFGSVLYIIIAIALVPAITEEFVFRSIVYGEYSALGIKKFSAMVLSALLFAMMHFDLHKFPVYFFGGLVFAFVTQVSGSVLCAMALHLLNNIYGLLFETQLLRLITQTDNLIFVLFVLAVFFLIFLILTLQSAENIYYIKGINGEPSPKRRKKERRRFSKDAECFLSPTFLICVIVFFVVTLSFK